MESFRELLDLIGDAEALDLHLMRHLDPGLGHQRGERLDELVHGELGERCIDPTVDPLGDVVGGGAPGPDVAPHDRLVHQLLGGVLVLLVLEEAPDELLPRILFLFVARRVVLGGIRREELARLGCTSVAAITRYSPATSSERLRMSSRCSR